MRSMTSYMAALVLAMGATAPARADSRHHPLLSVAGASTSALTYGGTVPVRKLDPIAASILVKLKRDPDPYMQIRLMLKHEGWEPAPAKDCRANLIGDDADEICKKDQSIGSCSICEKFPELQNCSEGVNYCLLQFKNSRSPLFLSITIVGEDNLERGDVGVDGVDFNPKPAD